MAKLTLAAMDLVEARFHVVMEQQERNWTEARRLELERLVKLTCRLADRALRLL